jgi:hypothetical protein
MKARMFTGTVVAAGLIAFATTAHAQGSTIPAQPPAPSTARPAQVAPSPGVPSMMAPPSGGPVETVTTRSTEPNRALLGTGLTVFAASYVPSVVVAATSPRSEDQKLYIPVAGPWLDLAQRPGCGGQAVGACNFQTANKTLLTINGIAQGAGSLASLVSFFVPQQVKETTKTRQASAALRPTVHFTPTQMGVDGAGVSAFGTW